MSILNTEGVITVEIKTLEKSHCITRRTKEFVHSHPRTLNCPIFENS